LAIGWIRIHRQIVDSDVYQMPPLYLRVFERLLIEANHQDNEIPYKKKGEQVIGKKLIKRGEKLTSVRDICKWVAWYERGKETIPNPKTIQNILDWLVENHMIEIYGEKGNRTETLYNIVNYNDYQEDSMNKVTEKKQSLDTNKNVKNVKNNIKDIPLKKEPKIFVNEDKEYLLAKYLSKQIAKRLEVPLKDESSLQKWSAEFERMVRIDGYDVDEVKDVLVFSQRDSFWQTVILSAGKFRKQYLSLLSKMKQAGD